MSYEEQISLFIGALRNYSQYQIDKGFERCLNECEFMPKLKQFHDRVPEQRQPTENLGKFIASGPSVLSLNRELVREICPALYGKKYEAIDSIKESDRVHDLFALANRERYRRDGVDMSKWPEPALMTVEAKNIGA